MIKAKNKLIFLIVIFVLISVVVPFAIKSDLIFAQTAKIVLPNTLEELRQTDPEQLATLKQYDSRKYNIVPPIENQGNKNICWSYATMAAAEISILREGLWDMNTQGVLDFWEDNNAFVSLNNDGKNDPLGLTDNDNFSGKWNDGLNPSWSVQRMLSTWKSPVLFGNNGIVEDYRDAEFKVENIIKVDFNDIDAIKYAIAKYGAVTMSYNLTSNQHNYYYNGNGGSYVGGHACAIIGWDDTIDKNKYSPSSTTNGGWIVRNSWGDYGQGNGYFYMSYDSKFTDTYALDFVSADKYEYNYHYDSFADNFSLDQKPLKVGNIFPAKMSSSTKKELLQAVNVGVDKEDTTINVDIYKNVSVDSGNIYSTNNNPENGTKVYSKSQKVKFAGNYTITIDTPIEINKNEYFSVVVTVSNPTGDARVLMSNEKQWSNNDMSYYTTDGEKWNNCGSQGQGYALRIKAFTTTENRDEILQNDLSLATVRLKEPNKIIRYGEDYGKIEIVVDYEGKTLQQGVDYNLLEPEISLKPPVSGTSSDLDIVGSGKINIAGIGDYSGENFATFSITVGMFDIASIFEVNEQNVPYFLVGSDVNLFTDIPLPKNWKWTFDKEYDVIKEGLNTYNYVEYVGSDANCYRKIMYDTIVEKKSTVLPKKDIALSQVVLDANEYVFTGNAITPSVLVSFEGVILVQGKDYTLEYQNNINAGVATIELVGIGNFGGVVTKTFVIQKVQNTISNIVIENGEPIATAKFGEVIYKYYSDSDCLNEIQKPTKPGTYYVKAVVEESQNWFGIQSYPAKFVVEKQKVDIANAQMVLDKSEFVFNHKPQEPNVLITFDGKNLQLNQDYTLEYKNNINVGVATIVVCGIGDYFGEKTLSFEIKHFDISKANILLEGDYFWTGKEILASVKATANEIVLQQNSDYILQYHNNINVGLASVDIVGIGNYTGRVSKTFEIAKAKNAIKDFVVNKGEPSATATYGEVAFKFFSDKECKNEIEKPVDIGTYYVKAFVQESENWLGAESQVIEYKIEENSINIANAIIRLGEIKFVYNEEYHTPKVIVIYNGVELVQEKDYTVEYINNLNAGKAQVVVNGIGRYFSSNITEFVIEKAKNEFLSFEIQNNEPEALSKFGYVEYKYYADKDCKNEIEKPTKKGVYYVKAIVEASENYDEIQSEVMLFEVKAQGLSSGDIVGICFISVVVVLMFGLGAFLLVKRKKKV